MMKMRLLTIFVIATMTQSCAADFEMVNFYIQCGEYKVNNGVSLWIKNLQGFKKQILNDKELTWGGYFKRGETLNLITVYNNKEVHTRHYILDKDISQIISCNQGVK